MSKRSFLFLGLLLLIILSIGIHGDNWSSVTVQGTIIDGGTGKALSGAGVTYVWWFDTAPDKVEPKLETGSDGEFSLRLKLHWALYPYNLIIPPKYQPFELFFMKEGYASRWIDFGEFRVKRSEVPGQEIHVGEIKLQKSSRAEEPHSLTLMETR